MDYVQYEKLTKNKKGKKSAQSGASGGSYRGDKGHGTSSKPSGKGKKLPFLQDTCYRYGKGKHQKVQDCRALDIVCRGCGKKRHFEKVCLKAKHSTHSLEVPQASTSTAGVGASEPLYFDDDGQPVFTHMVSVPHVNKHLIKFPISLEYRPLRGRSSRERWNKMENSTNSTVHPPQTVLLKANTGADVNLMNRQTFNQLFGKAKGVLQPTPIRMENYGNTAVKVLRMFHAFLRWKDKVYKQLFYITDCDRSPNLLSRDAFYTLGVLKPCYTVENSTDSTDSTLSQVTPIHASNRDDFLAKTFLHQKMKGTEKKLSNCSNKHSISKGQLQGSP